MEVIEVIEKEIEVIEVIERGPQGPQGAGITTLTTQGDLLYRGATTGERLPIGTTGQILKVSSGGIPEWGAAPSSGVSSVSGTSPIVSSGGATPAISITAATTSAAGSMSAVDKTKLDGIASGAEVNVNADWNASSGDAQILNKPTIPSTAADVGAVPTSRTISAGTGLTGGGDLSANRTLAVTYGTTAGTACQGNDSRLSDSRTPTSHASSHQASGSDQITSLDMTSLTVTNASNSPQVKLKAKTFFGSSTGAVGILAESTTSFGNEPAFGFTGVNEAVSAYKNIGLTASGTSQFILNTNGNNAIRHAFPTESLDINGNLLLRDISAESQASYTGTPNGASSQVTIEALAFGVSGNDIEITFDGDELTINDAIFIWNEANPSNRAHLTGGDGTQIPDAGSIFLSGGVSASGTFNILEGLTGKRVYSLPDKDGTLAVTSDISKTSIGLDNVTNNAQTQAAIVPNTAPSAGQLLVGNAGGTAYAPASVSGDATLSSTGALTLANNSTARSNLGLGNSATLNTGTTAGTVAAGNHTHSQLHDRSHAITSTSDHTATANRVFYSNSSGQVTELALGAANTVLTSNGTTSAPSFAAVSAGATNLWIPASAWIPRTTTGCGVDSREQATNKVNTDELLFDTATEEYAQALVVMPSNYNNGTITARFYWTASSGSGGVAWGLRGRAYADDDALDQAQGTGQVTTDTFIVADDLHVTAATSAITLAGTPAANRPVQFEIYRQVSNASDTLGVDARLLGVEVIFN